MRTVRARQLALVLAGSAIVYLPLSFVQPADLGLFLIPWLNHIRSAGAIGAFRHPFGNYAPPYLYLLSVFSLLPLPEGVTIKLLAICGAGWLAWCVSRLVGRLGADRLRSAERVLLLPTVILNAPVLGQCDTFWTGCCILGLVSMLSGSAWGMACWAGLAFAFKAQAAFLAPFFLGYVFRTRRWTALAIPPMIYLLAISPAALAGWPMSDLLTIYLRQTQFNFIGDAPNLWAIPAALGVTEPPAIGYALGLIAAYVATINAIRSQNMLGSALLSALIVPFFLPQMLERFFFAGDVISLVIAFLRRDRSSIMTAVLIQAGSFASIIAYMHGWPWLNATGSLFMGAALGLELKRAWAESSDAEEHRPESGEERELALAQEQPRCKIDARSSVTLGKNRRPSARP